MTVTGLQASPPRGVLRPRSSQPLRDRAEGLVLHRFQDRGASGRANRRKLLAPKAVCTPLMIA
jgi:hypothetical protein